MNITFSHRPALGVSIGAFQESESVVVLAAAIVNLDSEDTHNGSTARRIISSRINDLIEGRKRANGRALDRFVTRINVPSNMTATDLINSVRRSFKPTPNESDPSFCIVENNPAIGIDVRVRMDADEIWNVVKTYASDARAAWAAKTL